MPKHRVRCNRCRHYHITWDPRFPRGCRAIGFKGKRMPEATVLAASGMPCLRFAPKDRAGGKEGSRT